jgi:hypothetical protein
MPPAGYQHLVPRLAGIQQCARHVAVKIGAIERRSCFMTAKPGANRTLLNRGRLRLIDQGVRDLGIVAVGQGRSGSRKAAHPRAPPRRIRPAQAGLVITRPRMCSR